jgi:hypothetical protein
MSTVAKRKTIGNAHVLATAQRKIAEADRALFDIRSKRRDVSAVERGRWVRQFDLAAENIHEQRAAMRREFAEAHGWEYAARLSGHHRDVFVLPRTKKRVAGTVYHVLKEELSRGAVRRCAENLKEGDMLPYSWHFPNTYDAILIPNTGALT